LFSAFLLIFAESRVKGHFLICYLTVLLERLFQFNVIEDAYGSTEIFSFFKNFRVAKTDNKYINTTTDSEFITHLTEKTSLPLRNFYMSETQIRSILRYKI
jgi:hypothetical protein